MKPWRLREFHPEDLDQLVEVWRESRKPGKPAVYSLSEVLLNGWSRSSASR
jgi:hypothetical protein